MLLPCECPALYPILTPYLPPLLYPAEYPMFIQCSPALEYPANCDPILILPVFGLLYPTALPPILTLYCPALLPTELAPILTLYDPAPLPVLLPIFTE